MGVDPRLVVALVGDPTRPYEYDPAHWRDRPWDDLDKVELEAAGDDTFRAILSRSARQLGFDLPGHFELAFYDAAEPRGYAHSDVSLTLVDDAGRALWGVHDFTAVPYSQIVRSAEAGTIVGDPRRIVLVIPTVAGGGVPIEWWSLQWALDHAWSVITYASIVGGAIGLMKFLREALEPIERAREIFRRQAPTWTDRGATMPTWFVQLVDQRAWRAADLAPLLELTIDETETVLRTLGFEPRADDGPWVPGVETPARLRRMLIDAALANGDYYPRQARAVIGRSLADRLRELGDESGVSDEEHRGDD